MGMEGRRWDAEGNGDRHAIAALVTHSHGHGYRRNDQLQRVAYIPEHAACLFHSNGDLYPCLADGIALPYCTTLDLNTGEVTHERVLPPPGPNE